jgi:hypothetical protein
MHENDQARFMPASTSRRPSVHSVAPLRSHLRRLLAGIGSGSSRSVREASSRRRRRKRRSKHSDQDERSSTAGLNAIRRMSEPCGKCSDFASQNLRVNDAPSVERVDAESFVGLVDAGGMARGAATFGFRIAPRIHNPVTVWRRELGVSRSTVVEVRDDLPAQRVRPWRNTGSTDTIWSDTPPGPEAGHVITASCGKAIKPGAHISVHRTARVANEVHEKACDLPRALSSKTVHLRQSPSNPQIFCIMCGLWVTPAKDSSTRIRGFRSG